MWKIFTAFFNKKRCSVNLIIYSADIKLVVRKQKTGFPLMYINVLSDLFYKFFKHIFIIRKLNNIIFEISENR